MNLQDKPLEWQTMVPRQLARMQGLEILDIGLYNGHTGVHSRDGINLRLETGIDILSCLIDLNWFCFTGMRQEMDEDDAKAETH